MAVNSLGTVVANAGNGVLRAMERADSRMSKKKRE